MVLATIQWMTPRFEPSSPHLQGQSNQLMSGYRCLKMVIRGISMGGNSRLRIEERQQKQQSLLVWTGAGSSAFRLECCILISNITPRCLAVTVGGLETPFLSLHLLTLFCALTVAGVLSSCSPHSTPQNLINLNTLSHNLLPSCQLYTFKMTVIQTTNFAQRQAPMHPHPKFQRYTLKPIGWTFPIEVMLQIKCSQTLINEGVTEEAC